MPAPAVLSEPQPGRALAGLYRPIARDLERALALMSDELGSAVPFIRDLVTHLSHYQGKRLRPGLLLLTAKACGTVTPKHHILAAVVEMVHTATLVHDDVLDHAQLRRHVATVNQRWGNAASVLLGDLLFTHAFYLASTTGSALACRLIGEATNRVCAGELRQIGEQGNLDLREGDYLEIVRGKTAELTACCCRLGAAFAEAPEPVVENLTRYGRSLGIAFQIADDLLDLLGREEEAGKSLGTDLKQLKLTLPLIHALHEAAPALARELRSLLNHPEEEELELLQRHLRESGSIAYAIRVAERYASDARQALSCLPLSECRQILEDLTHQVVHRAS